jgi:multiple sugar transport system ATP-binding protein
MNFFDTTLIEEDGTMYADCKDFRLEVPESRSAPYKSYLGKEVVIGVRPEHVHDPEYPPPGITPSVVEAKVEITELMGNEVNVFFTIANTEFMGRFDPRTKVSVGMTKSAAFDMSRVHVFNKQTERAIR